MVSTGQHQKCLSCLTVVSCPVAQADHSVEAECCHLNLYKCSDQQERKESGFTSHMKKPDLGRNAHTGDYDDGWESNYILIIHSKQTIRK